MHEAAARRAITDPCYGDRRLTRAPEQGKRDLWGVATQAPVT